MTNPMLAELDEVVRQLHEVDGKEGLVLEKMRMLSTAGLFIKAHHAEIADMAKRLEAAERKVSRLTAMRNEWERDAREYLMTFGQHLPASVECLVERFDAAIDAAQEGEG